MLLWWLVRLVLLWLGWLEGWLLLLLQVDPPKEAQTLRRGE